MKLRVCSGNEKTRSELIAKAIRSLPKPIASKIKAKNILVVGDTQADVSGGRALGCRTLGVLTGFHNRKILKKAGADYIFINLKNTQKFLSIL